MQEKERELINDVQGTAEDGELSSCCGAGTYGDYKICEDCGEHC